MVSGVRKIIQSGSGTGSTHDAGTLVVIAYPVSAAP